MKKEIKKMVEGAVSELKKIKEVKAVYLFGSQATGKPKPYSDIDIFVFIEKRLKRKIKNKILGISSKKIDVSFFHELPVYIQYRVLKNGIACFVEDEMFIHQHTVSTIKNYLDFKPTLDRYSEITLKNL